jgi:hypothetical protein
MGTTIENTRAVTGGPLASTTAANPSKVSVNTCPSSDTLSCGLIPGSLTWLGAGWNANFVNSGPPRQSYPRRHVSCAGRMMVIR